jgi:AcrR family transcriptional regulator
MHRRRGRHLEDALLDAAWAELTERGYAGFTLESVAKRAGTSTPVIYRRWANKALMVEAAVLHATAKQVIEVPDTGTLRGDLIAMMQAANSARAELIVATAALLGGYFEETGTNPVQLREQVRGSSRSAAEPILRRAADRGEVDRTVLKPRLISLPFDLFRHEVLMTLSPLPDDVITQIVDDVALPVLTRHTSQAPAGAGQT